MSAALSVVYDYEMGMFNEMLRIGTTVERQKLGVETHSFLPHS
jgi:hypothetical protein